MAKSNAKYNQFFCTFQFFLPSLYTIYEARLGWGTLLIWYLMDIFTRKSIHDKQGHFRSNANHALH